MPLPKGKSYEQIYGAKRAKQIKEKLSVAGKKPNPGQFKKGHKPDPKALIKSSETIKKQSKSIKDWYKNNPKKVKEIRNNQKSGIKAFYQKLRDEGMYEKVLAEKGKKISKAKKGKKFSDKHRKALSKNHWKHSKDADKIQKQICEKLKGRPIWNKGLNKNNDERMRNHPASQPHSVEWCKNARMALNIRPTTPEIKFQELCEKYNLPYKYVGDGQFWLGYPPKNPDFLNVNGEKKIVEIDGVYWHLIKRQEEEPSLTREIVEREEMERFEKYGFKCIIIWEDEVSNEPLVLGKLGITIGGML